MFRFLYLLCWIPLMLCLRVRCRHRERVPHRSGCLVCCNHTSMLDVIVLYRVFWRKLHFMGKKELFRTVPGNLFYRSMGAFPVNRGGADVEAIRTTMSLLKAGKLVCMFPQGTRRPHVDPRGTEVRAGAGMIAFHTGADVLPVRIVTKTNQVRWFHRTEVVVGEVLHYDELGFTNGGMQEYKQASELIFDRICALGETEEGQP